MMPLECGEGVLLYRLGGGWFACILGKHHMQLPPLALNTLPEQGGTGRSLEQCAHTLGLPNRYRLALVGCWLGLDGSHAGVLAQV